jgi:two-component system, LytTR family, sensor kinase
MEQNLVILLVKLAVAASFASVLSRSQRFQNLLLHEDRTVLDRVWLSLGISAFCAGGATLRLLSHGAYQAADLGLEGCFVAGLLGGYVPGLLTGVLVAVPAVRSEFMSMPLYAAVGVMGGLVRDLAPDTRDIWRFSPFLDVSLWRVIRQRRDRTRNLYHLFILCVVLLAEFMRHLSLIFFGQTSVFSLHADLSGPRWMVVGSYITTLFSVALPIKIWSNARNERLLEAKERLLVEANLRALSSQINPHFLFNTLNTVSSLIRTNPEQARRVVYQLSHILRRLLRKPEGLTPLKEEISFIEDYLSIEMTRFGDKLRFEKDVAADTHECQVPSMVLQPIVENSIKHGLSKKVEGGFIRIESRLTDGTLRLTISDNGVGMDDDRLAGLLDSGIGLSNVNQRLKVLFGDAYRLRVESRPGEGTRTDIDIPVA